MKHTLVVNDNPEALLSLVLAHFGKGDLTRRHIAGWVG